jgi:hypothetical protein
VYQIIFHEFDPLNVIPDISINAQQLKSVQAEVFSKVERDRNNKYFQEISLVEETTYVQNLQNKED